MSLKDIWAGVVIVFESLGATASAFAPVLIAIAAGFAAFKIAEMADPSKQFEKLKDKAAEAKTEFTQATDEVTNLSNQLKEIDSQINSLKAQGALSLADKAQLADLEAERKELEAELAIKEKLAEIASASASTAASEVLTSKKFQLQDGTQTIDGVEVEVNRGVDIIEYTKAKYETLQKMQEKYNALLQEQAKTDPTSKQYKDNAKQLDLYKKNIVNLSDIISENSNTIKEYYDVIKDNSNYAELTQDIQGFFDYMTSGSEKAAETESKIATILSKKSFAEAQESLVNTVANGGSLEQRISEIEGLDAALKAAGISAEDFATYITNLAGTEFGDIQEQLRQLSSDFFKKYGEQTTHAQQLAQEKAAKEWDDFFADKSDEEISIFYNYVQTGGFDISEWDIDDVAYNFKIAMNDMANAETDSVDLMKANTKSLVDTFSKVQEVVQAQGTGKSISVEAWDSAELSDYREALEYVNGSYQLNTEKVRELVEAKADEQRVTNDANKALAQSTYLENAGQIEQLRQKIVDKNFAEGESAETIQATIDSLLSENDALSGVITQYDLMNASLDEATSAYQNWINAQSATQTGAMFDSAVTAAKKINDTINKTDSNDYGRIGNADYKAAVEFVLPEGVDSQDTEAVNKYLKSLSKVMTLDDNGNFTGLNIEKFCERAVDKGLMVLEGDEFKIAGEMSMKDFAEGMGYSLPFVQAAFGEMQEFGGEFTWADEAVQTFGDLGVAAVKAAEHIRSIEDNSNLKLVLDVSSFEDNETAIETLQSNIDQLNDYKATLSVDSKEYEEANTIIQYCITQKQLLTQPDVMTVDTSKVTGDLGEVLSLLQQFQSVQDTIEMKAAVGADTSKAEKELADLQTKLQGVDIPAGLNIDTSSIDTIKSSIAEMDAEMIVKAGVDSSLVDAYEPSDEEATVKYGIDTTKPDEYEPKDKSAKVVYECIHKAVDMYNPSNLNRTVTYNVRTNGTPPSGGSNSLNGTAHVGGTAYAGGNWGTATGGKTLVGELGRKDFATLYGDI